MGTISLPIPWADYHRAGHPWAFSHGQPDPCPFCRKDPLAAVTQAARDRHETEKTYRAAIVKAARTAGVSQTAEAAGVSRQAVRQMVLRACKP